MWMLTQPLLDPLDHQWIPLRLHSFSFAPCLLTAATQIMSLQNLRNLQLDSSLVLMSLYFSCFINQLLTWCSSNSLELNRCFVNSDNVFYEEPSPNHPHPSVWLPIQHHSVLPLPGDHSRPKKAQQEVYFLQQVKKFNLLKKMMVHFYTAITPFSSPPHWPP